MNKRFSSFLRFFIRQDTMHIFFLSHLDMFSFSLWTYLKFKVLFSRTHTCLGTGSTVYFCPVCRILHYIFIRLAFFCCCWKPELFFFLFFYIYYVCAQSANMEVREQRTLGWLSPSTMLMLRDGTKTIRPGQKSLHTRPSQQPAKQTLDVMERNQGLLTLLLCKIFWA